MKQCVICNRDVLSEDAPLLSISAYGRPKFLCEECSADLDAATLGKEYGQIASAMDRIGRKMSDSSPDKATLEEVNAILESAAKRAVEIKSGSYDFSLDEIDAENEEAFDDIPEELRETEEDRELDKRDEEKARKFDKIFNWVTIGVIAGAVIFVAWRLLDAFVF